VEGRVKEYHVVVQVFVVVPVDDAAGEEQATQAVEDWLSETCPFDELEVDSIEATACTADEELRRMHNAPNN
jgi:hypothetical protein